MDRGLLAAVVLSLTLSGSGCSEERSAGPQVVNWNTDTCERCRMVLSDPKYAAQVRFRAPEGRSQVRLFDDLGCAVLWLEDKPFREAASTEIWVTDWRAAIGSTRKPPPMFPASARRWVTGWVPSRNPGKLA